MPDETDLTSRVAEYYLTSVEEVNEAMQPPVLKRARKVAQPKTRAISFELGPLNDSQEGIVRTILETETSAYAEHLIWGVTGSGKTRIYEHLIAAALSAGEQVLMLVPEIALSSQVMEVIQQRFPGETVLYHSGLAKGMRRTSYERFATGDAAIAIGTRSAVFMPAKKLSLIVIDEEHDASYKDQRRFRFDTRTVARLRQEADPNVKLVMGSATPSMESLGRAKSGSAKLYRLKSRATGQRMPDVYVPEYKLQHGLISPFLQNKMHEHLAAKNQVLLLMNRRGHSTHVHCDVCDNQPVGSGMANSYAECPRCVVALTYHKDGQLRCHQCGYSEPYSVKCPKDGSLRRLTGRGIQRVEEILEEQFSRYSYARLDRDTARQKDFAENVLISMRAREIDILVGTQMIAKGFDLEGVTLVGVLAIDQTLTSPDFRASELTWQLLAQVVGRSGRHQPGEVVIQTMAPHHPAILAAAHHNADEFYAAEAAHRRITKYPPFGSLARLILYGQNEDTLIALAEKIRHEIEPMSVNDMFRENSGESVELLGPAQPGLSKAENEFRLHFLVKSEKPELLHAYLKRIKPVLGRIVRATDQSMRFVLDIEPREMG